MTGTATEKVDVVVVGGGLAGLAAAWRLRDRNVLVLEAADRLGGRIRSEPRGTLWLNFGAHVFGGPTTATGRLIVETGVEARDVPGALAAVSFGGRLVAGGAAALLPFRLPLDTRERLALVWTGLRLRAAVARYARVARERVGESPDDRQARMLSFMDDRPVSAFLGTLPPRVDSLLRCTLTRAAGEPEELSAGHGVGYFHLVWNRSEGLGRNILGGSQALTDALAGPLGERARLRAEVLSVVPSGDGVEVTYRRDGEEHVVRAAAAVVCVPAPVARTIVRGLPAETDAALGEIRYGPLVVGAFRTDEDAPSSWDSLYAVATPGRSFSMAFNMANVLRGPGPRVPGSSFMVYATANLARALAGLDDEAVAERFARDLDGVFPGVGRHIVERRILRLERGVPFPAVGRAELQDALTRDLGRVSLAGDYLGTWYTDTCIWTGERAAVSARRFLD